MNKLLVVPARGGSKGINKKNIYPINGKPLLEYTLDVIKEAGLENTDIVVSTDSKEIKEIALKSKGVIVIDRPDDISGDTSPTEEALLHAINFMEKKTEKKYDAVITLQATSPLRRVETLRKFIQEYQKNYPEYDALISLSETRNDYWIEFKDGKFERLYKNAPRRRQERKPIYIENGAYYITNVKALRKTHSVLGTHVNGFVISEIEGIDINEPADLLIAKNFIDMKKQKL